MEHDLTTSCRPLVTSVVRLLGVATVEARVTEPSAEEPSLIRFTARVSESPGTKLLVVTGTVAPCCVTSMERVPDAMVAAIGVLLSVKVPKVPMPATAAAAPRTPSEPTTLRAVELFATFLAFMTAHSLCPVVPGDPGDRENSAGPTAGPPPAIRKESARTRTTPRTLGAAPWRRPWARRSPERGRRLPDEGLGGLPADGARQRAAVLS